MEQRSDLCGGEGGGGGGWLEVLVDVLESTLGWGGRRMVGHCGVGCKGIGCNGNAVAQNSKCCEERCSCWRSSLTAVARNVVLSSKERTFLWVKISISETLRFIPCMHYNSRSICLIKD